MPRTLVLDGPRQLRLADMPTRPLRPGEIRLRALLSGISHGTELSLYRGTSAFTDKVFDRGLRAFVEPPAGSAATYPVTLGYEMVGEVTEVAPDVTEIAVGDLVPHRHPPPGGDGARPGRLPAGHLPDGPAAHRRAARAGPVHQPGRGRPAGRPRRRDEARGRGQRARARHHRPADRADVPAGGDPERLRPRPRPGTAQAGLGAGGQPRARPVRGAHGRPPDPRAEPRPR